ncbi:MAG TPA: rod shape-determining protein MreC [Actinomycetes bacterium]|nr:rod shape-determining protein MreC [Actinomycetes bacterium]
MRDTRRTRIVLAVLLLTAFTFITIDARGGDNSLLDKARSATQGVLGPIERAAAAVVSPVSDFIDGLTSINSNQQRIDDLEAENDTLQRELLTNEYDQSRVQELDKLLNIAGLGRYKILPAQVIAVGAGRGYARTVLIDAGTRDGLSTDLTVLNGDGLVGRVIEVGPSTATVLLMADPTFTVGARMASSLEMGYVTGQGADPMELGLLDAQAEVARGDLVVTAGSKDNVPFVPGVPIGEVVSVKSTPGALTRTATVHPFADLTALDLVGVVVEPFNAAPRDATLPPVPTPTPTTSAQLPLVTPPNSSLSPSPGATTSGSP